MFEVVKSESVVYTDRLFGVIEHLHRQLGVSFHATQLAYNQLLAGNTYTIHKSNPKISVRKRLEI